MATSSEHRRSPRRRQRGSEAAGDTDRWMVSYADFMTLLFAFFVAMYGMSQLQQGDEERVSRALSERFYADQALAPVASSRAPLIQRDQSFLTPGIGGLFPRTRDRAPSASSSSDAAGRGGENEQLARMADRLRDNLQTTVDEGGFDIRREGRRVEVVIQNGVLFPSGSPRPSEPFISPLESVARVIRGRGHQVRVEGYTDNVPIEGGPYPSNWELSAARAATVVRLFSELGVTPERLSAIGRGEYQPVATNNTPTGRARNRRVVISISPSREQNN